MTVDVLVEPAAIGGGSGGLPARRAVARWAWRLFRREWRQQALVLALLSATVAAAIGFMSAAYTMAPVPGNAEFGSATDFLKFEEPDPQAIQASVAAARQQFGTIDVIDHRDVAVPGVFRPIDLRAQAPEGAYTGPLLDLRQGSYPTGTDQIAVTDGLTEILHVGLGSTLSLEGVSRTVVGIVEDPSDLSDEFALVAPQTMVPTSTTVLLDADDNQVRQFRAPAQQLGIGNRPPGEDLIAAVIVLVMSTVVLLLAALVATASFVVLAQRRARQLGMLAAIGGTEKQLRNVTVVNGAVIGAAAAVIGCTIGLVGWVLVSPRVESAVGYRFDSFDLPWLLIGAGLVLAVLTATLAAWWPARAVARMPTVAALSGRPPQPRPARRSAALALIAVGIAVGCLFFGGDLAANTEGNVELSWVNAVLILAGVVALVTAMLLASPPAIRLLAAATKWLPVAVRLALSDMSRYRARSGSALAALSLVLGIAVTIIVTTTAAQAAASAGNLSDRQLIVRHQDVELPYVPKQADVDRVRPQVDRIAAELDRASVTELTAAFDPTSQQDPKLEGRFVVSFARPHGDGWQDVSPVYVASAPLLALYGRVLDDSASGFLSTQTGDLRLLGVGLGTDLSPQDERPDPERVADLEPLTASFSSLPGTFVTPDELRNRHWSQVPIGTWLIQTAEPLTSDQLAAAREIAANTGLTIEVRDRQQGLAMMRTSATVAGMLVALGILAMTVGLIRSETGRDLRVLTAAGARRATRRTITAATAGGLALLAVLLGTAAAYLGLVAGFGHSLHALHRIPIVELVAIAIGVPLAATVAAWLVSGREPAYLARQPIE